VDPWLASWVGGEERWPASAKRPENVREAEICPNHVGIKGGEGQKALTSAHDKTPERFSAKQRLIHGVDWSEKPGWCGDKKRAGYQVLAKKRREKEATRCG